jgi:Bacterial Ig-like domain (group 3)
LDLDGAAPRNADPDFSRARFGAEVYGFGGEGGKPRPPVNEGGMAMLKKSTAVGSHADFKTVRAIVSLGSSVAVLLAIAVTPIAWLASPASASATPFIKTTPSPASPVVGDTLNDSATLEETGSLGGSGSLTFNLYGPDDDTCSGTPVYSQILTNITSDGPFITSPGYTPSVVGIYDWTVIFSGDSDNSSAASPCGEESLTVSGPAFTCTTPTIFLSTLDMSGTQLYDAGYGDSDVATSPPGFSEVGSAYDGNYNAVGFDANNNYLYAMIANTPDVVQIDSDGDVLNLGPVEGIPDETFYDVGAFDGAGNYWVMVGGTGEAFELDVASSYPEYMRTLVFKASSTDEDADFGATDFTFEDGYMWGFNDDTVYRLDLSTGTVDAFGVDLNEADTANGAWTYDNGDLGFYVGGDGKTYRISVSDPSGAPPTFTEVAEYSTGIETTDGDAASCAPDTVTTSTSTTVNDVSTSAAWSGSETTGASAYDTSTVTTSSDNGTPTGTVTYNFFTNGTCDGTAATTDAETLNDDGTVPNSTSTGALDSGSYSFEASYDSGNTNYANSTSGCEPFSVAPATSSVSTVVDDGSGSAWSGSEVTGATAYDTSTVSGVIGFTPTGNVTYSFFANGTCTAPASATDTVALSGGTVPQSSTTPALGAGPYSFEASYSGDGNYSSAASGCESFSVGMASASVNTAVNDGGGSAWSSIDTTGVTAHDTSTVNGVAGVTPTGTVTYSFFTNGTCIAPASATDTVTLSGGTVPQSSTTSSLAAGTYAFQASYSGDTNYISGSTSSCEFFIVSPATPSVGTTVFDASTNAAWSGSEVTGATAYDTSTVTGVSGFTPSGTLAYSLFTSGGCTGTPASEGTGLALGANSSTTSGLAAGTYGFEATYSGDSNYTGLTSGCESFIVGKALASASTAVDDPALPPSSPAWNGSEVTGATAYDTSTVTGVSGFTPTGTVTYNFFTNGSCTAPAMTTDTVTLSGGTVPQSSATSALAAGTYGFEATYSGDSNYSGLTSSCEAFTVNTATPSVGTTVFDAATNAAWSGSEVTGSSAYDTSTVTGVSGFTPTGTISYSLFTNGSCSGSSTPEGTGLTVNTNSSTASALAAGTYGFEATYSGDSNYAGLTSGCESFTVSPETPVIGTAVYDGTNTQWNGTEATGATAYDTSTVTGVTGFTPTGTVTYSFFKNGTCSGTASTTQTVTLSGGIVPNSNATAALAAGNYSFGANYVSTSSNYANSTSGCEPFTVAATASSVGTVVHDVKAGWAWNWAEVTGASAYDSATVTKLPGFTPTGTLTYSLFKNGTCSGTASTTQTVTLSGGIVPNSNATAPLAAGSYSFQAGYSGDTNYKKATSSCEPFSVAKAPTFVGTVVIDAKIARPWDWAEVTGASAYDTSAVPGFTPTGTVTYSFFKNGSCTGSPSTTQTLTLSGGKVPNSATTAALAPGSYCFKASYSGDTNYEPSTSCLESFTVTKAMTFVGTVGYDARTGKPWSGTEVAGATAYDSATATGVSVSGFAPTGTVTYTLHSGSCSGTIVSTQTVTLSGGKVPNSSITAALAPGSYCFQASYSGDTNYYPSTSCETFSVLAKG